MENSPIDLPEVAVYWTIRHKHPAFPDHCTYVQELDRWFAAHDNQCRSGSMVGVRDIRRNAM